MICRDCGRVDGLKVTIEGKEAVCESCLAYRAGCQHKRVKLYKDFVDGSVYSICRNCSHRQEL